MSCGQLHNDSPIPRCCILRGCRDFWELERPGNHSPWGPQWGHSLVTPWLETSELLNYMIQFWQFVMIYCYSQRKGTQAPKKKELVGMSSCQSVSQALVQLCRCASTWLHGPPSPFSIQVPGMCKGLGALRSSLHCSFIDHCLPWTQQAVVDCSKADCKTITKTHC